jgi:hypothetical protein
MKVLWFQELARQHLWGIVLYQVTAKVSAPQISWCVPWFVAPQGLSGEIEGSEALDFYAFSWGISRKPA